MVTARRLTMTYANTAYSAIKRSGNDKINVNNSNEKTSLA